MARQSKQDKQEENAAKVPKFVLSEDPVEDLNNDQLDALADEDEFDIFSDVGDKLTKSGDRVTYTIKRDGEFIAGSIRHPFSWDRIQKDYGAGSYQVTARSMKKGGYVKSESRHVAAMMSDDSSDREDRNSGNSTADLLMLLQAQKREEREEQARLDEKRERDRREQEEKREQERKEREETMRKSGDSTMMLMMKMMEQSSAQTTALLTAMITGNQKKEPEINVEKIMQMMDARTEKLLTIMQGKDKTKDIDAIKLMELTASARAAGRQETLDLMSMAEKKAEELAELRESAVAPAEKESTTKMLIESVVPAMQTLFAARGGIPMAQAPALPAPTPMAALPHVNPHRPAMPPKPMTMQQTGLPRAPIPQKADAAVAPKKEANAMSQKDLIENTVVTEMSKDLGANMLTPSKLSPEKTAENVLKTLEPFGITPELLCSRYSLSDMMVVAKAKGMPDAIKPYIERFHAFIEAKAGMGSRGTPESGESGNS